MKTVFLIGNGFDINLGLKTSYSDFYDYYLGLPQDKDSKLISDLKTHIKNDINGSNSNWSDLEIGMGNYTENLKTFEEIEITFDDLNDEMYNFICTKEESFDKNLYNATNLKKNLCHFFEYGSEAEKQRLLPILKNYNESHFIDIITFNYTSTLEKLLEYSNKPIDIGQAPYLPSYKTIINSIIHIHGDCEDPIMGLNDEAQIKNERLRKDIKIINYLIKPKINSILGNLRDKKTFDIIKNSKLICLYGLSFGNTDKKWWELIGERILDGIKVILFIYDSKSNNLKARKLANKKLEWQDFFMSQTNIPEQQKDKIRDNIIIIFNSPIFNIKNGLTV